MLANLKNKYHDYINKISFKSSKVLKKLCPKLYQKINLYEFEVLSCTICFDEFDNGNNNPITLMCGHTFCLKCL